MWAIFLFYEIVLVGLYTKYFGNPFRYILVYSLNITFFYFHAKVTLMKGLRKNNSSIIVFPVLLIVEIICYISISYISQLLLSKYTDMTEGVVVKFDYQFCLGAIFRACYFIVFSTGYYFLDHYLKERKKAEDLEKTRLENIIQIAKSENAYLRAQINPHFLFNTLDFIYHNARERAPIAAESISVLSDMMRYAVDSAHQGDIISLGLEISQVENLINLHQLRENHSLNIRLWYDDDASEIKIIPLVLLTIVENMFKHGELNNRNSPGNIYIKLINSDLIIQTKNKSSYVQPYKNLSSGLENIKKRLKHAYSDNAVLSYHTDETGCFCLTLKIISIKENKYQIV